MHCVVWAKELYKLLFADPKTSMMFEENPEESVYMHGVRTRCGREREGEGGREEGGGGRVVRAKSGVCGSISFLREAGSFQGLSWWPLLGRGFSRVSALEPEAEGCRASMLLECRLLAPRTPPQTPSPPMPKLCSTSCFVWRSTKS